MMLSKAQRRALEILRDNPGIAPRAFAKKMWPDSEGHKHHTKCGNKGVSVGGGMNLAAGGFLGKLAKAGLVAAGHEWRLYGMGPLGYFLTVAGKAALREASDASS